MTRSVARRIDHWPYCRSIATGGHANSMTESVHREFSGCRASPTGRKLTQRRRAATSSPSQTPRAER